MYMHTIVMEGGEGGGRIWAKERKIYYLKIIVYIELYTIGPFLIVWYNDYVLGQMACDKWYCAVLIWDPTTKFNSREYFWLYGRLSAKIKRTVCMAGLNRVHQSTADCKYFVYNILF